MKKYLYIFASLLLLAGCSDRLNVEGGQLVPDGEMAVNLKVDGPMAGPGTRSYINGTETAISTIKMLCFDGEGAFITDRDGTLTPTDATHGSLTGTVPANTVRIHFIANFEGLDLSSFPMGSSERVMMKSATLSSGKDDPVRFWGYHKENSPSAMASYLNGGNTVILLRDRAKVTVINNDSNITSLQWTITNGLNRGFVAAASASDNANPYDNTYATSTVLTEYRSSGVYELTEATASWASAGTGDANAQFLFENANSTVPVKIIIKATFDDGTERYHTILLQDNDKKLYRVYRNQSFVLTIQNLPSKSTTTSIGSDTFADAVATTNYSNNPFAQVAREVNEVNDDTYKLTVESVSKIFDSGSTGTVNFTFTKQDGTGTSFNANQFEASWEPKADTDERPDVSPVATAPVVTYNASTGEGTITFNLNEINTILKYNTLQIVSPSGLTRYVDIYSISQFSFATAPTLVDNGTKRTVGGVDRETYKLTFALPDNLPAAVYPMTVKMYTGTLVPFSNSTATAPHGSFNIAVGSTSMLDATDQSAQWNYNANKWGSWYEYVIDEPSSDNTYTVYLNEFVAESFPALTKSTVGLYFEIENFGDRLPLSAAAPQPTQKTVTFNAGEFSFSNRSASLSKQGVTISFENSEQSNGYITTGYSNISFNPYHNGIITISGVYMSRIVVNYNGSNNGGTTGASSSPSGFNQSTGIWTGSASEVTLTMGRTGGIIPDYAQVTSIVVTYMGY